MHMFLNVHIYGVSVFCEYFGELGGNHAPYRKRLESPRVKTLAISKVVYLSYLSYVAAEIVGHLETIDKNIFGATGKPK